MLDGRDWYKVAGASNDEIERLKSAAPIALPDAYLRLLSFTNGGEGPLPVQPFCLCLFAVDEVVRWEIGGELREFFPRLFVVGSNGGDEAIALDYTQDGAGGVVYFSMTNIDLSESLQPLAPSFDVFLDMIGVAHE